MNTSVRARRDALGFSMVELLITIIISGIAFAALVPMFVSAQQKGAGAQYRSTAINLAQDRIERLRQLPWNALTDALTTPSPPIGGLTWGDVTVGGKTYTVDLLHIPDPVVGQTQKTVSVKVTWYEQPGHVKRERVLTTNIFRQLPGPQITDVSFDPSPVGNWIREIPASGVIKITATVNPAQALDCKHVRFTVVDTSGILPPDVSIISTPTAPTNNQFLLQWQGQDAAGNPVKLHDGLYRVTAVAYSQDTNGQTSLPGNTYPRDIRIETERPLAVVFEVYPGKVEPPVVNLLFSPSSAPDWDYFQIWRNGSLLTTDTIRSFGYKDLAVKAGETYQYKVRAVDTAGTALDWDKDGLTAKLATPTLTGAVGAPSQPTGLTVSFTGVTVKLSWLPPDDLTWIVGYHVYRDTTNTVVAAASSMADVVSYSVYDSIIDWLTTYVYTVLSFTADGVESPVAGLASGQVWDASGSGWATVTTPEKPIYDLRMTVYSTGNKDSTVTVTDASMGAPLPGAGYTATKTAPSASRQVPMGNYIVTATSGQSTKSISVALTGDPTQAVWIAMTL